MGIAGREKLTYDIMVSYSTLWHAESPRMNWARNAARQSCVDLGPARLASTNKKNFWGEETKMRRLLPILFAAAVVSAAIASNAQAADDYPTRPIRLVVGFGPGGSSDILARNLSGVLTKELGQSVVVENVTGASGYIGWRTVASASPDGYTLLMGENAIAIRPGFKDMVPHFDPLTQFDSVALLATSPLVLCVTNKVSANNMKELIALSRSSPQKLNFASAGLSSVSQLVWDVIQDAAKIDAVTVPYRGGGPAMAALVAGQVDMTMPGSQVAKALVDAKRIKAIAITSKRRSPALPDVPTLEEQGIKHADVDLRFWFGVFGPKGMPAHVKAKLEQAIEKSLQSPVIRERLAALDITPEFGTGAKMHGLLDTEIKNWKAFIEAKGLKAQ